MSGTTIPDRAHLAITKRLIETGQAPFYTELAKDLGLSVSEGRKALHELIESGMPGFLFPDTDHLVSYPPFNNLPNNYRISIDGEQKWFGQGGFESLAVSWLFPGKKVVVDFPCLDCGDPLRVEMRDGKILNEEANSYLGYVSVPFNQWFNNLGYAGSRMNLFRSEEHVRNWESFVQGTDEGILPILGLIDVFSGPFFRNRLDEDYASRLPEYEKDFMEAVKSATGTSEFWKISGSSKDDKVVRRRGSGNQWSILRQQSKA